MDFLVLIPFKKKKKKKKNEAIPAKERSLSLGPASITLFFFKKKKVWLLRVISIKEKKTVIRTISLP